MQQEALLSYARVNVHRTPYDRLHIGSLATEAYAEGQSTDRNGALAPDWRCDHVGSSGGESEERPTYPVLGDDSAIDVRKTRIIVTTPQPFQIFLAAVDGFESTWR